MAEMKLFGEIAEAEGPRIIGRERIALTQGTTQLALRSGALRSKLGTPEVGTLSLTFTATADLAEVSLAAAIELTGWTREDYLMMPAGAYDGNRFRVESNDYPPMYAQPCPNEVTPVVTGVPKFDEWGGTSGIHLLAGGLATPAIGAWRRTAQEAIFVLSPAFVGGHEVGLHAIEEADRLTLRVDAPGLRPVRYQMCDASVATPDRGVALAEGDSLTLSLRVVRLACASMAEFYRHFGDLRELMLPRGAIQPVFPFSAAAGLVIENFDARQWAESEQTYVDVIDEAGIRIQPGWVGSGMFTLAVLGEGTPDQQTRAARSLDYIVAKGLSPFGLFYGMIHSGGVVNDGFSHPQSENWLLLRKNGDMTLFLVRQCQLLEQREQPVPPAWRSAVERNLEAYVSIWDRYQTFGQFVNVLTGEIVVGGATGAGTVVGALAAGGAWLNSPRALEVARQAGAAIAQTVIEAGYSVGGPGEILKAPDSESCAALIEGLVELWEVTGEASWLQRAADVAYQALTWTVSYDFDFPRESTFARMGMQTTGTVIASVQNKHSAPGICSLSSLALLKIARATDDATLRNLAVDIARTLPQYVSRADRPIPTGDGRITPPGFMNERVNMSDWELYGIGSGEVFYGNCWCTTSMMLTAYEMPGIYVEFRPQRVSVLDHVTVESVSFLENSACLRIHNPCPVPARVKVVLDPSAEVAWAQVWADLIIVEIAPGETQTVDLKLRPDTMGDASADAVWRT